MKAAIVNAYGSPDVLTIDQVEVPAIGDRDVLIRVHASPVTQGDRRLRSSDFPGFTWLPGRLMTGLSRPRNRIPGTQFAGRVVAIGDAVTRFEVGDDVFGGTMHSAQAEYLSMPEDGALARMPGELGHAEAAAVPYGAVTALHFLRDMARVQPGERVLIVGASGGVGRFAVQIARHLGAEVTGVASGDLALVRELGADRVIDYRTEDITGGDRDDDRRYHVIFDTSGALGFRRARHALTATGRFLSLMMSIPLLFQTLITAIFRKGRRALTGVALATPELLEQVRELVDTGAIRPVLDRRFPLKRIADAHVRLETARPHGSVVVTLAPIAVCTPRSSIHLANS